MTHLQSITCDPVKITPVFSEAKFAPGMYVRHRLFGYVGLIFDVDARYSQSEEWYEMMAKSAPKKDSPWYYVMVDGESHTTYVSEDHLIACENDHNIDHPMFKTLFTREGDDVHIRTTLN
ncbi:heat shock protein HspQ [Temperatibacter marinus]|uniref:Heat shock protein HspQ n=1 Tax=Temperatibacter marinus TaxID=1456591 RepID=A0AA52H8X9_9PROT|nr:heat shock protein HspQ [Temperatibacter marinus]WND02586.1 heat shock protein HspQ [Temperatibacter marinus]